MEFDHKPGHASPLRTHSTIAVSMASIDSALTELVDRMEREIAQGGTISHESAREVESLRIGAEQLLSAQTDNSLSICR